MGKNDVDLRLATTEQIAAELRSRPHESFILFNRTEGQPEWEIAFNDRADWFELLHVLAFYQNKLLECMRMRN